MSFQVVVVTGAASGIGAAIALCFAKLNACLCITDMNEQDLRKTGIECQKLSKSKVSEVVADITKDEDPEKVIKYALKEFGKIDVLVNCAGIYLPTNFQDLEIMEKFDKLVGINLRSIVAMTKNALPALIKSKGCVINISSVCANVITNDGLLYCTVKAGVTTFTKCAAKELAQDGVRVNCISPGPVRTNIFKNHGASEDESNVLFDNLVNSTVMKKCVEPEEIAEAVVYLASDKAASITGADFVVDAGMTLGIGY